MKVLLIIFLLCLTSCAKSLYMQQQRGKHLFILSGQSNMARLEPEASFIPAVESEFGSEQVEVVKHALGGQPIRRWYKEWKPLEGETPKAQPDIYDTLMNKVRSAINKERIATVTFVWMQGERDARERLGEVYEKSLIGLYHQLCHDLKRKDVNFVIGRLSDFDLLNEKYPHWSMIRDIQVKVADSNTRFDWINTDDLNDGFDPNGKEIKNDLHMSVEGYVTMGKRLARKSIDLIKQHENL